MVKVLRSIFGGPLEPYAAGFAQELLRQGFRGPRLGSMWVSSRTWTAGCAPRVSASRS
jgi:hypothetical protein